MFSGGGKVSSAASMETVAQRVVLKNNRHFLDVDVMGRAVDRQLIGSLTSPGTTRIIGLAATRTTQDTSQGDVVDQEDEIVAFVESDVEVETE